MCLNCGARALFVPALVGIGMSTSNGSAGHPRSPQATQALPRPRFSQATVPSHFAAQGPPPCYWPRPEVVPGSALHGSPMLSVSGTPGADEGPDHGEIRYVCQILFQRRGPSRPACASWPRLPWSRKPSKVPESHDGLHHPWQVTTSIWHNAHTVCFSISDPISNFKSAPLRVAWADRKLTGSFLPTLHS